MASAPRDLPPPDSDTYARVIRATHRLNAAIECPVPTPKLPTPETDREIATWVGEVRSWERAIAEAQGDATMPLSRYGRGTYNQGLLNLFHVPAQLPLKLRPDHPILLLGEPPSHLRERAATLAPAFLAPPELGIADRDPEVLVELTVAQWPRIQQLVEERCGTIVRRARELIDWVGGAVQRRFTSEKAGSSERSSLAGSHAEDGQARLTFAEQAIAMLCYRRPRSIRALARAVGCQHSSLSRNVTFKKAWGFFEGQGLGAIPRGRVQDGSIDAFSDPE